MSRKRWRVSRTLRVLLACLALWLPARTASASFGLADTVLIVGADVAGRADVARASRDATQEGRTLAAAAPPAPFGVARSQRVARPAQQPLAVNRTVVERRYLRNCVLLR